MKKLILAIVTVLLIVSAMSAQNRCWTSYGARIFEVERETTEYNFSSMIKDSTNFELNGNFLVVSKEDLKRVYLLNTKEPVAAINVTDSIGRVGYKSIIVWAETPPNSNLYVMVGFRTDNLGEENIWIENIEGGVLYFVNRN